ncbi:MAG: polysaccharide deacetylase family protein [Pirellulales bacterium]|nr:polysaccharide deacetylase family protein [Pirellulales bacterium]
MLPAWKSLLLSTYYHGSRPYRSWALRRAAARGRVPIVIFFYHRVADDGLGSWTLSNRQFARQMDWLQSRFEMLSLDDAQRRLREGRSERPAVCVTFDDGYAENNDAAIPLLIERKIPCTYFVTLHNVLSGEPFAHDVALGNPRRPNTLAQLRDMAAGGIEIAAHCRHHDDLGKIHDPARLEDEIVAAGRELADALGQPVRYLAVPFGHYVNLSAEAVALARRAGYRGLATAYGGYNYPGDDPFLLQRIHGDPELARLKNRATIDPRNAHVPRFRYAT